MKIYDRRPWPVRALDAVDASRWGALLLPFSWIYLFAAWVDRGLRPPRALPPSPPTVGIGNLRVGGTGKTPVAEDLARRLSARTGLRTQLLARGYRAEGGGDEAGWLRERGHTVILSADRSRGHAMAEEGGAELILLDDSLQSRHRPALQLALLLEEDLRRMPRPLPAGRARGGRGALSRADAICIRVEGVWPPVEDLESLARRRFPGKPCHVFRLAPSCFVDPEGMECPLDPLPDALRERCVLLSGLARPESFERDLRPLLPRLEASIRFADHAHFGPAQITVVREIVERGRAAVLLAPEKNRERLLAADPSLPLWTLRSEIEWLADPSGWIAKRIGPKR